MMIRDIDGNDVKVGLKVVHKLLHDEGREWKEHIMEVIHIGGGMVRYDNGGYDSTYHLIRDYYVVEDKTTGIPTFDGDISLDKEEIYRVLNDPRMRHFNGFRTDEVEFQNQYQAGKDLPQGTKLDSGKLKPALLLDDMPLAIQEILKVLQFGAEKYSEGNWLKVPNGIDRYRNAADRHRLAIDELDDESGMMHLAHEATSVLMLLELKLREKRDAE